MFAKSIDKSRELITVDVNGWPVHYRSFVKPRNAYKTPIVCLAGLFENDESLVKSLEKVFVTNPVYLVYMPGFLNNDEVGEELTYAAYSMLLNSFISSLGIDSCHLISHSYTANIAVFFVDHFADRVTNITFISPVTQMRDSVKYIANQNIRSINEGNQKAFAARESLNYVPTFSDGSSHEVKNLVKEHYLNILNPENKLGEKYRAHIERLSRFTEESVFIKGVKNCPVTVVSGERDLLTSPQEAFDFSKSCHQSLFILIEDSDNLLVNQKSDIISRLYKRLLDDKSIKRMVGVKLIETSRLDKKLVRVTSRLSLKESGFIECEDGKMLPITLDNLSHFGCKFTLDENLDEELFSNVSGCRIHFNYLNLKVEIGIFSMDNEKEFRGIFSHASFDDHEKLQSYIKEFS